MPTDSHTSCRKLAQQFRRVQAVAFEHNSVGSCTFAARLSVTVHDGYGCGSGGSAVCGG